MEPGYYLPVSLLLLGGLFAYVMTLRYLAQHLRYAWDILREADDDEDRAEDWETLFERVGMTLSAARLFRILSLLITIPSVLFLLDAFLALPADSLPMSGQLMWLAAVAAVVTFVLSTAESFFMRGFYTERLRSDDEPSWLIDSGDPVPAPIAAAALLWDWIVRRVEVLMRGMGFVRPKAYFIEREDELLMAVGESEMSALGLHRDEDEEEQGDRTEIDMVRAIQRLDETLVREVMRPLNKVTAIHLTSFTPEKFLSIARRTGYTRFPVYYDQLTNLVGYLNVHDFLETPVMSRDVRKLIHEPLYIPEVAQLDEVLQEMLRKKRQIAICFDEFGGCSGLLSREDIIEEITGEIMDEYDRPEKLKWEHRRNDFLVDASIDLDDLAESVGLELEKRNCDTLAGYIYHRLSRVPRRGEVIEEHDWVMEIVHMDKHRIAKVRLVAPPDFDAKEARRDDYD